MKDKIIIVDYGMGNLFSVRKKLYSLGIDAIVTSDKKELETADKIILPGVGHFAKAMENLKNKGLIKVLNQAVLVEKKPVLGICLGVQLMAKFSEEGNVDGLGWIDATVERFKIKDTLKYKVPQMGWNTVSQEKDSKLMHNISLEDEFYFVHSYHLNVLEKEIILNKTNYEYDFVSAIEKDNIFGVQYHPEKSHNAGAQLIKNFIEL